MFSVPGKFMHQDQGLGVNRHMDSRSQDPGLVPLRTLEMPRKKEILLQTRSLYLLQHEFVDSTHTCKLCNTTQDTNEILPLFLCLLQREVPVPTSGPGGEGGKRPAVVNRRIPAYL